METTLIVLIFMFLVGSGTGNTLVGPETSACLASTGQNAIENRRLLSRLAER
jgi:hypothetical protein